MTGPDDFPYKLLSKRKGLVTGVIEFHSPIIGYHARISRIIDGKQVQCELYPTGLLVVFPDTVWDFGTGAIDTPDVVRASLAHDMFCHLTDSGLIPWQCRRLADQYYRDLLLQYGSGRLRANMHFLAVRANSKFNAYWRRTK